MIVCDEGDLEWIDKEKVFDLNLWEGDRIFFRLLQTDHPFFSLRLSYIGDQLESYALDGKYYYREDGRSLYEQFLQTLQ